MMYYQQVDEQANDEDGPYQLLNILHTGVVGAVAQHIEIALDKGHCKLMCMYESEY